MTPPTKDPRQTLRQTIERALRALRPRFATVEANADRDERQQARELRIARLEQLTPPIVDAMREAIIADRVELTAALQIVRQWHAKPTPLALVLHGVPGSGKTVAAADLAARVRNARWANTRDLLQTHAADHGELARRWHVLHRAPLLILDAVGDESDPARMLDALREVLALRSRERTVITTRLSEPAFAARYRDEAFASLMTERATHATLPTLDMRQPPTPLDRQAAPAPSSTSAPAHASPSARAHPLRPDPTKPPTRRPPT